MSISNNALIFYHTYTIESKKKSVYFTDFSIKTSFSLEYRDRFERLLGYNDPEKIEEVEPEVVPEPKEEPKKEPPKPKMMVPSPSILWPSAVNGSTR